MGTTPITSSYFYPRSPRGERRYHLQKTLFLLVISIHAPREGSDWSGHGRGSKQKDFYPRSPQGEGPRAEIEQALETRFLSTRPPGGAPSRRRAPPPAGRYFYPRSPRGERPQAPPRRQKVSPISIHAPREGSDVTVCRDLIQSGRFLSTLPARGATQTFLG